MHHGHFYLGDNFILWIFQNVFCFLLEYVEIEEHVYFSTPPCTRARRHDRRYFLLLCLISGWKQGPELNRSIATRCRIICDFMLFGLEIYQNSDKNQLIICVDQWFSNLSWGPPASTHFVCLPHRPRPFQVLQTLLMSWWVESGVLNEGDIQNMLWLGVPRTGLRTTGVDEQKESIFPTWKLAASAFQQFSMGFYTQPMWEMQ